MQTIPANELLAGLTLAEPADIHAVVTDSRKVEPGCVFVCFPGERVDGHTFAAGAYRNGAAYIIAPAIGVWVYSLHSSWLFGGVIALCLALAMWGKVALREAR